jgi:tight adherence protein B
MSVLVPFLMFLILLAAALVAMLLWTQAKARERQEDVLLRLRAGGDEALAGTLNGDDERIGNPLLRWTCHLVWRTGAETEPAVVARWLLVFSALVPIALVIFGWQIGLVVLAIILVIAYALLARQAARRRAKIIEQLPDFLEQVTRILSAGNTLEESIIAAAKESPDPLRALFLSVGRQVRLGAPVESVLTDVANIHQVRDLLVMAMAASINRKYGGSLRSIFRSLVQAIRNRDMAAREVRALTAETRFSAVVLAVIPVGICLYILALNPEYYGAMWDSPGGRGMLLVSVLMQLAGVAVIWRMLRGVEDGGA